MLLPYHQPPAKYTGELFGIQYLYQQSLPQFSPKDGEEDEDEDDVDEGLGDEGLIFPPHSISEDLNMFNSSVEPPLFIIENLDTATSNPSVEDDGCNEVYCVSVYVENPSIIC